MKVHPNWKLSLPLVFALLVGGGETAAEVPRRPVSPAVVNQIFRSELRPWLSLDGEWDFALDPSDVGEKERWYAGDHTFPRSIRVPGTWEAQSVGEPGLSQPTTPEQIRIPLRHKYLGTGWYRKTFALPNNWRGKQVWLKVGGVNSQAWFWLNGESVGHLNSYCGTYKFDVTPLIQSGRNTLVARASNKVTSRKGLLNWLDQWGGFYRSVELEATAPVYIDDVWVQPDFDNRSVVVRVQLAAPWRKPDAGDYRIVVKVSTLDGQRAGQGEIALREVADVGAEAALTVALDPFRPWSPERPFLYKAEAVLHHSGQPVDSWVERIGVRKLERRGADIYLNGKRYFLRGFGDDYVYPLTLSSPPSREEHKKHLELARAYGFNYVRHHTHVENPEYFQAAEEVGILIQPELPYYGSLPSSYGSYLPLDDLNELIRHYRRYTALATYCMGNEGLHAEEVREPLFRLAKLLDPGRLVLHQDGEGTNYEGIADFRGGPVRPPLRAMEVSGTLPVVLHEYLNLAGPPDWRLEPHFSGAQTSPYGMATVDVESFPIFGGKKEEAEMAGVDDALAERIIDGGHELQSILQKLGLEHARSFADLDGYDYWTVVDVSALMPQGLLDLFWRPKRTTAKYFRRFNAATVLLLPELSPFGEDRVFASGENVSWRVACSNYGENDLRGARLNWTVAAAGKPLAAGRLEALEIIQGGVTGLGQISFVVPPLTQPVEIKLQAEIEGTGIRNEWSFYGFPKPSGKSGLSGAYAAGAAFDKLSPTHPRLRRFRGTKTKEKSSHGTTLITERLDEDALQFLQKGGSVLLVSLADFSPLQPGMRLGWWKSNNQRGTALAAHPAFGEFPCEEGLPCLALFRIFRDAVKLDEKLGPRVEPLMVTLGKENYLASVFQARVGSGKLFASGLDLLSDRPEAAYLLQQFLKHVQSAQFKSERELSVADLRTLIRPLRTL